MEFKSVIKVIIRWIWLIGIIVGATGALLFIRERSSETTYESTISLEITRPDSETVALYDEYNYRSERDEIVIALNKFIQIAKYDIVRERTLDALGSDEDYDLVVDTEIGADFVYITVGAGSPERAQEIARMHAQKAIEYFGELRMQPLNQALAYFRLEAENALMEVEQAEAALTDFQQENGLTSIQDELSIQTNVLNQLEVLRWVGDQIISSETGLNINDVLGAAGGVATNDPVYLDELIRNQRQRLVNIAQLEPEYYALQQAITTAREKQGILANKLTEAELKASFASKAFFIQVIEDASLPTSPVSDRQTLVFGLFGALGVAILLAFVLDYFREGEKQLQPGAVEERSFRLTDQEVDQLREAEQQTQDASELIRLQAVRLYGTGMRLDTILDICQCGERDLLEWVSDYQT